MQLVEFGLVAVHAAASGIWLGAMAYSLLVVQPRAEAALDAQEYEQLAVRLAAGARWKVLSLCALIGGSGLGLTVIALPGRHADASPLWWGVLAAKTALLLAAVGVFAYVSWVLWPRRLFAGPAELPALRRQFRRVALMLLGLVGGNFVLGLAMRALFS
ncbi:MAG: hypothetical protein ACRD0K_19250 [Egibacteraceae bacterium]